MIMQLKDSLGVFRPLDVFDDFEIKYNHQYEDYKTIGGKIMPYTDSFKVPLTPNNRELTGVIFDATYPNKYKVDGRMLYNDLTVAFYFVADILGQTINTLQPYIEISIIDRISKAISDLSKYKMSDLFANETINFTTDSWFFGNSNALGVGQSFIFPAFNFNNKNAIFAYDAKRKLCQLQPTFVLHRLFDKIFNYVGVNINSDFLTLDNQLAAGVLADNLGLMIPFDLRTNNSSSVNGSGSFVGVKGTTLNAYADRVVGVPSTTPTSSRIAVNDFMTSDKTNVPLKMNYDWRSDTYWNGSAGGDIIGQRMCSTVNGKVKMTFTSNNTTIKPYFTLGKMWEAGQEADYTYVTNDGGIGLPQLEVLVVDANMERRFENTGNDIETSMEYDARKGQRVGYASYVGLDANGFLKYEITFDTTSVVEFDVEANQDMEFALIFAPADGVVFNRQLTMTSNQTGGTHVFDLKITLGYTQFDLVSSATFNMDLKTDMQSTFWYIPSGSSQYPFNIKFEFLEFTNMPSGFNTLDGVDAGTERDEAYIVNCDVDLGESFKAVNDYSLLDVVKLIMERFNLQFYSDSTGLIWIDTEANRLSNTDFIIDHLIDEGFDVNFTYTENGILTVSDQNPSFYEDDFNRLDKFEVSPTKRDEVQLSFKSCIVSDMYEDVYDGSGYDVLKYKNDSNYWGTADRTQQLPKALKPTFCFLQANPTNVYFPYNECSYSYYETALDLVEPIVPQVDFGFYNTFRHIDGVHPQTAMNAVRFYPATGFSLASFQNDEFMESNETLFKKTWYDTIMDVMNDNSVIMDVEIYASEDTFKKLIDYPTIKYKGQDWKFKGFKDYPLTAQNGGIIKISLIKKNLWN